MEFLQPYLDTIKNHYFDFEGRVGRRTFWMFFLVNVLISIILSFFNSYSLSYIYSLAILLPSLGIGARRLHDVGKSGWWQLISIIPLVGIIVLIVFWAQEGQPGANEYGEAPQE